MRKHSTGFNYEMGGSNYEGGVWGDKLPIAYLSLLIVCLIQKVFGI